MKVRINYTHTAQNRIKSNQNKKDKKQKIVNEF